MKQSEKNDKMAEMPVKKLMLVMGAPMIISMVLQALYNIVDSAFISNMAQNGESALNALTLAFPFQMLMVAQESGLDQEFISELNANSPTLMHDLYLSTNVVQQAVLAQDKVIRQIADNGNCVIVGRAADYVLRNYSDVIRIFIYAPKKFKIQRVMEVYGDDLETAEKNIHRSDEARAAYYKNISGNIWGERNNYELLVDSSVGLDACADVICEYIQSTRKY